MILFPTEVAVMAIHLPDARELSDDVLEALRLHALRGCELGLSDVHVAEILGVARETVCRWSLAKPSAAGGPLMPEAVSDGTANESAQEDSIERRFLDGPAWVNIDCVTITHRTLAANYFQ